jgi:hypothetical protein
MMANRNPPNSNPRKGLPQMQKQGEEYWKFKQRTTRPIPTVEQTLQHTDLIDRMIGTNIYYFCPLEKNHPDYEFGKGEWLKGQITGKEKLEAGKWVHEIQLVEDGVPIHVDLLFDTESWFFYPPIVKKDPTLEADCHLVMDWDEGPFANEPGDRTTSEYDDVSQAECEPVKGDSSSENEPLSEKMKRISKPQPSRASSRNAVKLSKAKKGKAAVAFEGGSGYSKYNRRLIGCSINNITTSGGGVGDSTFETSCTLDGHWADTSTNSEGTGGDDGISVGKKAVYSTTNICPSQSASRKRDLGNVSSSPRPLTKARYGSDASCSSSSALASTDRTHAAANVAAANVALRQALDTWTNARNVGDVPYASSPALASTNLTCAAANVARTEVADTANSDAGAVAARDASCASSQALASTNVTLAADNVAPTEVSETVHSVAAAAAARDVFPVPARDVIFAAAAMPDSVCAAAWQIVLAGANASERDLVQILLCVELVQGVLQRMAAREFP